MKGRKTEQYDLEGEQWRDLIRFPYTKGIYQISNLGRWKRTYKNGKILYSIGTKDQGGHLQFNISINGKYYATPKVHDLVFEAFYRRLLPNEVVHHISQVKTQNIITNLVAWDKGRHMSYHVDKRRKRNKQLGK